MGKMIAKLKYNYKKADAGRNCIIEMDVDLSRFDKQYGKAQFGLDSMVMNSMIPFMPARTGVFINITRRMSAAIAGSGNVYAAAPPYGRFLYEGKNMVDEGTGSPWARIGAKKVLVSEYGGVTSAKEKLSYSKNMNPLATDHWFDAAKRKDGAVWIAKAKQTAGGG